jgi:hypothetical protein
MDAQTDTHRLTRTGENGHGHEYTSEGFRSDMLWHSLHDAAILCPPGLSAPDVCAGRLQADVPGETGHTEHHEPARGCRMTQDAAELAGWAVQHVTMPGCHADLVMANGRMLVRWHVGEGHCAAELLLRKALWQVEWHEKGLLLQHRNWHKPNGWHPHAAVPMTKQGLQWLIAYASEHDRIVGYARHTGKVAA